MISMIFIAPHFDDICFSIGGLLPYLRVSRKILINIFTRSGWMTNPEILATLKGVEGETRVEAIGKIRNSEDDAFALAAGFEKTNLDLLDADLIAPPGNTNPAQFYEGIENEVDNVCERLLPLLQCYLANGEEAILMAPLAIGLHRNHIVTFAAIVRIAPQFPQLSLMFYEDLPYSCIPANRQTRLAAMGPALTQNGYKRYYKSMDEAIFRRKLREVVKYKSQMNRSLDQFAIRIGQNSAFHEAVWTNWSAERFASLV